MLNNNFFTSIPPAVEAGLLKTTITLNPSHDIFNGHFPGLPVVPGVCMMQIVKEVLESYADKKLRLVKADNVKFLSFIDPGQHGEVGLEIKIIEIDGQIKADAQLVNETVVFLKFKGTFK